MIPLSHEHQPRRRQASEDESGTTRAARKRRRGVSGDGERISWETTVCEGSVSVASVTIDCCVIVASAGCGSIGLRCDEAG